MVWLKVQCCRLVSECIYTCQLKRKGNFFAFVLLQKIIIVSSYPNNILNFFELQTWWNRPTLEKIWVKRYILCETPIRNWITWHRYLDFYLLLTLLSVCWLRWKCTALSAFFYESLFALNSNTRKKPMSRNNSPDSTVRLNTALNTALIKNE